MARLQPDGRWLCPDCTEPKPRSEFGSRSNGQPLAYCREHERERDRLRRAHPDVHERRLAYQREHNRIYYARRQGIELKPRPRSPLPVPPPVPVPPPEQIAQMRLGALDRLPYEVRQAEIARRIEIAKEESIAARDSTPLVAPDCWPAEPITRLDDLTPRDNHDIIVRLWLARDFRALTTGRILPNTEDPLPGVETPRAQPSGIQRPLGRSRRSATETSVGRTQHIGYPAT